MAPSAVVWKKSKTRRGGWGKPKPRKVNGRRAVEIAAPPIVKEVAAEAMEGLESTTSPTTAAPPIVKEVAAEAMEGLESTTSPNITAPPIDKEVATEKGVVQVEVEDDNFPEDFEKIDDDDDMEVDWDFVD